MVNIYSNLPTRERGVAKTARRVPAFDGIRALAAIAVLLYHFEGLPTRTFRYLAGGGWYGVDVFFVLSGFLITRLLVSELEDSGVISLRRFYTRRALRLYPAFISAIIIATITAFLTWTRPFGWQVAYLFTYVQNVWLAFAFNPAMSSSIVMWPAWSLCIEEQFYLLWPLALRRVGAATATPMLCGVVAISILARIACYFLIPHVWSQSHIVGNHAEAFIYYFTLTRLDSIGIGCILSLCIDRFAKRPWLYSSKALWTYAVCVIVLILFGTHCKPFYYTVGSAIVALAVGVFVTAIWLGATNSVSRILSAEPLVEIGRVSYGIYLFQTIPVHWLLRHIVVGYLHWLVWIVFIVAIAEGHYRLVEKYFLSLGGSRPLGRP